MQSAIAALQPRGVIVENVAALAGRGLEYVLWGLHEAGYNAEWDVVAAAGVGAPHLRERLFIIAWRRDEGVHGAWPEPPVFDNWLAEPEGIPRLVQDAPDRVPRLRCLGNAVVPQVAAHVASILADRLEGDINEVEHHDSWDAMQGRGKNRRAKDPIGHVAEVQGTKMPRAGRLTGGMLFERERSCTQKDAKAVGLAHMAPTLVAGGMLPTPTAGQHNAGEDPQQWLERREELKAKGINGNGAGMPLGVAVKLIPTPKAADGDKGVRSRQGAANEMARGHGGDLDCYAKLLPTPRVYDAEHRGSGPGPAELAGTTGMALASAVHLLPTPTAADGASGPGHGEKMEGSPSLRTVAQLLPTPRASENENRQTKRSPSQEAGIRGRSLAAEAHLLPTPRASEWKGTGPLGSKSHDYRVEKGYLDATVQELEQQTGRLNPAWVEFLMGFPNGWSLAPSEET